MTAAQPAARVIFVALAVATFAAFFVTQRLKRSPAVVQDTSGWTRYFSPNGDGVRDEARVSFRLKEGDDVTVDVVDADGEAVRTLADDVAVRAYRRLGLRWDGRDDDGRRVPDGRYRLRIGLRAEGRSVTVPRSIELDTTPPRPRIVSISPADVPGAELLPRPSGGPVRIRYEGSTREAAEFPVYRTTDPRRPRQVTTLRGEAGSKTVEWDGTADGRPLSGGTYLVGVIVRDRAGNIGTSPRALPPRPGADGRVEGRGGVTIRHLAAQPPLVPVRAGELVTIPVDARREPYTWSLRRVGALRPVDRGRKTSGRLVIRAPRGISGVFVLRLRTARHAADVPLVVQSRKRRGVLVVLPALSWQGTGRGDDDGDGLPNGLDLGAPVKLARPMTGLPSGFRAREAPLLVQLDRSGRRYDLTTDLALARGEGPRLEGHSGVVLAGDERWITSGLRNGLRRFARRGGTIASFGVESLRADVRLTRRRAVDPSPRRATDIFGTRLRRLSDEPTDLIGFQDDIELFAGTDSNFPGWKAYEETAAVGPDAEAVATAVTPDDGRPVLVAAKYGRGLVIRTGLPDFAARIPESANTRELAARIWTLLKS